MLRADSASGTDYAYTYDNAGNILSVTKGSTTYTYTYGDSDWGDLLTAYDGQTFTYDTIGNLTDDGTWDYTWQHGRQLASMTDGTNTWNFTYNADGLRTKRTNGSTTYNYIYNGDKLSQMTVGSDTLYFAYDAAGTPMAVTFNGTTYYYVTNVQGDVLQILDANGAAVSEYSYDAWGNILTTTGSMASTLGATNPLRYRGYVYDQDTELYYLQSRYYDPDFGRFLNADAFVATGQDLLDNNMFAYCSNNPVLGYDPTGYWDWGTQAMFGLGVFLLGAAIIAAIPTGGASLVIASLGISVSSSTIVAAGATLALTGTMIMVDAPMAATTSFAKTKGKERMRDTGLANESDADVQSKAHDKSLPKSERQKYVTEEKARGLRNKTKRRGKLRTLTF